MSAPVATRPRGDTWRQPLKLANAQKQARARLRWALKRREIDIRDALDEPAAQGMKVLHLLGYLPGNRRPFRGRAIRRADAQARRIAVAARIHSETLTVSALSAPRRSELAAAAHRIADLGTRPIEPGSRAHLLPARVGHGLG